MIPVEIMMAGPRSLLFDLEKGTRPVLELLQSDQVCSSVEYIRVEYWGDGNVLVSDDELIAIFGLIGRLPRIKELRIEFDELPLPALALKQALSCQPSRLRYLALEDVRLSGTKKDFEEVAEAVKNTISLRTFRMYRCGPFEGTTATLDPIIEALADVPSLRDVLLSSTHVSTETLGKLGESKFLDNVSLDHMTISAEPLAQLCKSASIKELKLWGMPEINDDITFMTESLYNNKSLKVLRSRYCHLNEEAGAKVSQMLCSNDTLETIVLENMNWPNFGAPLAKCFEANCSLVNISLSIDCAISNLQENAAVMISALEDNTSLRKFRILLRSVNASDLRAAFIAPMEAMLLKNYTLETVYLNGNILDLGENINFFLKLNQTRKRHIFRDETATKEDYIRLLAENNDDVSIAHYVLVMNPSLFRT